MCTMCNIEKYINNFHRRYTECKDCNCTGGLKRYCENKNKISNQQQIYFEKRRTNVITEKKQ